MSERPDRSGQGLWQDYIVVPETHVVPIPDSISNEVASQFLVNPLSGKTCIIGARYIDSCNYYICMYDLKRVYQSMICVLTCVKRYLDVDVYMYVHFWFV